MVSDARAKGLAGSVGAEGFMDCSAKEREGIKSVFDLATSIAASKGVNDVVSYFSCCTETHNKTRTSTRTVRASNTHTLQLTKKVPKRQE